MADLVRKLPAPRVVAQDEGIGSFSIGGPSAAASSSTALAKKGPTKKIPPYGKRTIKNFVPRKPEDFGDGGAFPEITVAQYPRDMGRKKNQVSKTVALQTDADGKVAWDAVLKQGQAADKLAVFSRPEDQKAKWTEDMERPGEELDKLNSERTMLALAKVMDDKAQKNAPQRRGGVSDEPQFLRYTPNQQAPGHNSGCQQRVIRVVDRQKDPLMPVGFKHKRLPRGPGTPPPPMQHSPARKLTQQDMADWKIPPCISNWKNAKGYTIALDKRLAADGRGYQDVTINDKFAMLSEDLYIAERKAREEIKIRNDMQKQKKAKEEEIREEQLRAMASEARKRKEELLNEAAEEGGEDARERQDVLKGRAREIERDRRLEQAGKRQKRDRGERDISEKVALGEQVQASGAGGEAQMDARLFGQSAGIDSGFADEQDYALYDKALFADRSKAGIYSHDKERMAQTEGKLESIGKSHGGAEGRGPRTAPVEFEKDDKDNR